MTVYEVNVQPDGMYWNIRVPALERSTMAVHREDIDSVAKDLISIMTHETEPAIHVNFGS